MESIFEPKPVVKKQELISGSGRIYYLDNLKFILITLVVIGHFIDPLTGNSFFLRGLFFLIYTFHMPLFVFITGLFSKSAINGSFKTEKVFSFLILYVLLKVIAFCMSRFIYGNTEGFSLLTVMGAPWYMLASAVWLCMLPLFYRFKAVPVICFAVVIGVLAGYDKSIGDFLCLSRILVFAPFFLLGFYIDAIDFIRLINNNRRIISIIFLTALTVFVYLNLDVLYEFRGLLTGRQSYSMLYIEKWGGFCRLLWYVSAAVISTAVMMAVPRRKTFYSALGQRTLQVYALHFLISRIYLDSKIYNYLMASARCWEIIIILLAILLSFILSLKIFEPPFNAVMRINFKKLTNNERSCNEHNNLLFRDRQFLQRGKKDSSA